MLTIKNYKSLQGWAHSYKDLRIGQIGETADSYIFRVAYNSTPYTIKIFRNATEAKEYEVVLRDGADIVQYGRCWLMKGSFAKHKIPYVFEGLIIDTKPKAQSINNPFYSNGPF